MAHCLNIDRLKLCKSLNQNGKFMNAFPVSCNIPCNLALDKMHCLLCTLHCALCVC